MRVLFSIHFMNFLQLLVWQKKGAIGPLQSGDHSITRDIA
jgi:hypothetical protein